MEKDKETFIINSENLIKLGIEPEEAIEYLENKCATTIAPAHVKALIILRESLISSS